MSSFRHLATCNRTDISVRAQRQITIESCSLIFSLADLPIFVRGRYANNASAFDLNGQLPQHVDIPRLKKGRVGGFFWYVFDMLYQKLCQLIGDQVSIRPLCRLGWIRRGRGFLK